eukprot:397626-Lingulodinium_polyedra.AAC.1
MEKVVKLDTPVRMATLDDRQQALTGQLMVMLTMLCKGRALRVLANVSERRNGLEAWRQLHVQMTAAGANRTMGLLVKILEFKFSETDFMDSMN